MRCPGQDTQYWLPSDIFECACPVCKELVEFFKDDSTRKCECGYQMVNPKLDLGCSEYCEYAEECMGIFNEKANQ